MLTSMVVAVVVAVASPTPTNWIEAWAQRPAYAAQQKLNYSMQHSRALETALKECRARYERTPQSERDARAAHNPYDVARASAEEENKVVHVECGDPKYSYAFYVTEVK